MLMKKKEILRARKRRRSLSSGQKRLGDTIEMLKMKDDPAICMKTNIDGHNDRRKSGHNYITEQEFADIFGTQKHSLVPLPSSRPRCRLEATGTARSGPACAAAVLWRPRSRLETGSAAGFGQRVPLPSLRRKSRLERGCTARFGPGAAAQSRTPLCAADKTPFTLRATMPLCT
jgi:hypothetical protein